LKRASRILLACCALGCAPRVPFGDDRVAASDAGAPATGDPALPPLGPKSAVSLGRYECDDLPGGSYPCQSIDNYSRFVYDTVHDQLLWFGGGSHGTARTDVATFELAKLAWESAYPPTPCADMVPGNADLISGAWLSTGHPMSRQTFDMLVMAESTGELVMLTYNTPESDCGAWPADAPSLDAVPGRVAHYAPEARAWRFSAVAANTWPADAAAEYDPESGLVVVLGSQDLWTYDPASEVAEHRLAFDFGERFGYAAELVYFPPNGRFYYFTRAGLLFELTAPRADWSAASIIEITDASGELPAAEAKGWAYDAKNRVIGGGVRDSVFFQFDPTTHLWSSTSLLSASGEGPGSVAFFTLAYAEKADVFLFFTDYASGWQTWAYRN
jgi:hypothetical protein